MGADGTTSWLVQDRANRPGGFPGSHPHRSGVVVRDCHVVLRANNASVKILQATGPAASCEVQGFALVANLQVELWSRSGQHATQLAVLVGPVAAGTWFARTGDRVSEYEVRARWLGVDVAEHVFRGQVRLIHGDA